MANSKNSSTDSLKPNNNNLIKNKSVASQYKIFRKIIKKAAKTDFGKHFLFDQILTADYDLALYKKLVPIYTYETIYKEWWKHTKRGDKDICWPGKIKYFALSSGSNTGTSKIIPVSKQMIKTIKKTSLKQIASYKSLGLTRQLMNGEVLLIGGSTKLEEKNDRYFGDMSGISMAHALPKWFLKNYFRPGYTITDFPEWNKRIAEIVKHAKSWNIVVICGMPNWVYLIVAKIIEHYKVKSIHDIWPNFNFYIHGGVFFQPYKTDFEQLLKHKIYYAETYMASEGFLGYSTPDTKGNIKLELSGNVFYEFIELNATNFDKNGRLNTQATTITIQEVKNTIKYAIVISNNSGAWRYLLGDIITFTDSNKALIQIIGRLGNSLNFCGEHTSSSNLTEAYNKVILDLEIENNEFTVLSNITNGQVCHHWFICGNKSHSKLPIAKKLDKSLMLLNDDYALARKANLLPPVVHIIPKRIITQWLSQQPSALNLNKMPVILNQDHVKPWLEFVDVAL